METNEFAKISKLADSILLRYQEVRKECRIRDNEWHSRTIECMAKPFIKGHFTLAVVGKVSSGKSTFINALLGCKNILPTGHDQTTCGITYIEYGERPEATIVFGDGNKTTIEEDIQEEIKLYVSIPKEYHNLPVNNIDDLIMRNYDFDQIWEMHKEIEEETLCSSIDKSLLKKYVNNRKKKDIAVEVYIKYPFSEELKGWRVIDTPGIGAIGGIENRTQSLLDVQKKDGSREVDAIIFLQKGSETLDQTDTKRFVTKQLANFSETDKGRLFYVLTHSSSSEFLNHKNEKLDFIKNNYGDKIKVLTYADSLLYSFINDLEGSEVDLKLYENFDQPKDWTEEEWDVLMSILDYAKRHLKKVGDTFNHDTMLRTIEDWSHFAVLKQEINQFAKNEKQLTLRRLIDLIATDYSGFVKQLDRDKKLVDGDLTSISAEIKSVEKKRGEYNLLAQKADSMIKIDRINAEFDFINEQLRAFENYKSIENVRTAITNLFDTVKAKEKSVFEEIINTFSDFFKDYDSNDIVLESIDFSAIEKEATSKSQETYEISKRQVIEKCCEDNVIIPAKYGTRTNYDKRVTEFKIIAIKRARSQRDKLLPQIKNKADNLRNQIFDELDTKIKAELERLENLKCQLSRREQFKAENDFHIAQLRKASKELIKLAEDYGFKCKN